jgi:NAD(P)-dependent dehydrogenase (short-subunit alcohol dehydrogenase family)
VLELDVTDDAAAERAVGQVIEQAGRIDVLVNNAGFSYSGITEAYTVEQAQRIFDTNFFGAVRMNRAVLPHMRRQGSGLLIHVSSGAGRVVLPGSGHYCASKFALEALAESYRYDLAGLGIDSVIIEPGAHPTPIFAKSGRPADPARTTEYGRLAEIPEKVHAALMASQADPQEVANAALELIETPFGKRPLRRVVGPGMGALQALNDHAAQLQEKLVQMFGLAELVSPRASEPRQA